jgi:hypothetical protein
MNWNKALWIIGSLIFTACSVMDRSPESGYSDGHRRSTQLIRKSSRSSSEGREETESENVSQKTRLKQLENSLSTRKETEQYSKALPWFNSDAERIEFLQLPGFEARQRWLSQQGFSARSGQVQNSMKELVEAQDIALGMPQNLVRQAWGEPDTVEVSGNPQFRNERWRYSKFVSSQDGYKPEKKTVYFEGGKVVGWDVE